jgi:hypothetical protein
MSLSAAMMVARQPSVTAMKYILKTTTKRLATMLGLVQTAAPRTAAGSKRSIPPLRPTVPTAAAHWRIPAYKRRRRLIGGVHGPAAQGR